MTAIKNLDLSAETVIYNGIVFDGSPTNVEPLTGTSLRIIPPTFSLSTVAEYDESDRTVVQHRHTLTVETVLYSSRESDQTDQVELIRRRLLEPGATLRITGLGLGFPEKISEGTAVSSQGSIIDMAWGPKPRQCSLTPFGGTIAHELTWVVEFVTAPCILTGANSSASAGLVPTIKALNYETTWSLDDEGMNTRTISGYVEILQPQGSRTRGGKTRLRAESVRGSLGFFVPPNFKRESSSWTESLDKSRLDFTVVDSQLRGQIYPDDIIKVTNARFTESFKPLGMAKASVTLSMTLTVVQGVHPSVAAIRFLRIAFDKQAQMQKGKGSTKSSVIATNMTIVAGMFDEARTSAFSIQWQATGCIADFLFSTPWEKIPGVEFGEGTVNTDTWTQTMLNSGAWGNRGTSQLRPNELSDAVINVCSGVVGGGIGSTQQSGKSLAVAENVKPMDCGKIREESSWLDYDVKVTVRRKENTTTHHRAVSDAGLTNALPSSLSRGRKGTLSNALQPTFSSTPTTEHVIERNGYPEQIVVLQMRGLRVGFRPDFPNLVSVDGHKATPTGDRVYEESVVTSIGGCPVYSIRGYQMYTVQGYIDNFNTVKSETICEDKQKKGKKSASDGKI